MNVSMYKDILDDVLLQSALDFQLGRKFSFQMDNDPKHTTKITKSVASGLLGKCPRVNQTEPRLVSK